MSVQGIICLSFKLIPFRFPSVSAELFLANATRDLLSLWPSAQVQMHVLYCQVNVHVIAWLFLCYLVCKVAVNPLCNVSGWVVNGRAEIVSPLPHMKKLKWIRKIDHGEAENSNLLQVLEGGGESYLSYRSHPQTYCLWNIEDQGLKFANELHPFFAHRVESVR